MPQAINTWGDYRAKVREFDAVLGHAKAISAALAELGALPANLRAALRQRMAPGDLPTFHLDQRQHCELSGLYPQWHHAVTMQLAQYARTLSTAVLLPSQVVGTVETLRVMALPLLQTLPFLVRTAQAVAPLTPGRTPEAPSHIARTMALWRGFTEPGRKGKA